MSAERHSVDRCYFPLDVAALASSAFWMSQSNKMINHRGVMTMGGMPNHFHTFCFALKISASLRYQVSSSWEKHLHLEKIDGYLPFLSFGQARSTLLWFLLTRCGFLLCPESILFTLVASYIHEGYGTIQGNRHRSGSQTCSFSYSLNTYGSSQI